MKIINILAICGSTKSSSLNLSLIKAIADIFSESVQIHIFDSIDRLPHFNPDLDNTDPPVEITSFRKNIHDADAVLICTPEYAMGVPGTLKNAIDWTVSSCEFSHKPVALITASSQGQKGHAALLETLRIIECEIPAECELVISYVKKKVSPENMIIDEETSELVRTVIQSLVDLVTRKSM